MGVYIKGIEMPRHCGECGIEWCDRWKQLVVAGMAIAKERPSDCPLVPVPPHGRLIDQDAILKTVIRGDYPNQWIDKGELLTRFRNAPTIIQSSEEEK